MLNLNICGYSFAISGGWRKATNILIILLNNVYNCMLYVAVTQDKKNKNPGSALQLLEPYS